MPNTDSPSRIYNYDSNLDRFRTPESSGTSSCPDAPMRVQCQGQTNSANHPRPLNLEGCQNHLDRQLGICRNLFGDDAGVDVAGGDGESSLLSHFETMSISPQ